MKPRVAAWALALAAGCGGSAPAGDAKPPQSGAPVSAEETCIAVANAEHPRRPDEPESITVSHVLVKHSGAKKAAADVTRSRGEACLRAMEARDKLRGGAAFEDIAKTYSDDKGVIGQVKRADVLPPFADTAFELDRGQLSDIVETELGFHVIMRTD